MSFDFSRCVFSHTGKCGPFHRKRVENPVGLTALCNLDHKLNQHAEELGVDLSFFSERSLIMNRAHIVSDNFAPTSLICPYHRYTYGIFWRPSTVCQLPYHEHQSAKATRTFSYQLCEMVTKMERFRDKNFCYSVGQPVCRNCIEKFTDNSLEKTDRIDINKVQDDHLENVPRAAKLRAKDEIKKLTATTPGSQREVISSQTSATSSVSMFEDELSLYELNTILLSISSDLSPMKYQVRQNVENLSHRTVQELKRQYDAILAATSSFICEGMAPGQGETLKMIFDQNAIENSEQDELDENTQSLLDVYQAAPSCKWKILLLATLPRSFTKDQVQKIFSCSRYAVTKSRALRKNNELFNSMETKVTHKHRISKERLEFFFHFLFTSGLIQDVAHGTTYMHFDTGRQVMIPHVIQTMMKSHIHQLYERHCEQVSYSRPLSRATVFRLLEICKMRQKKTLCGLDSFVVDGMQGFDTLEKLTTQLVNNEEEKKHLIQLLALSKEYIKVEYKMHVTQGDVTCITHCRTFALGHATDKHFEMKCNHAHSFTCTQCNALLATLCHLRTLALKLEQCDEKDEIIYDLETAIQDILELMFHIIRGAQQDESKKFALESLDARSGLLLSDWSMKITTQQHREKMDEWYGKRGISLHVDVLFFLENDHLKKMTYFTAIDRCPQDMISVLAVFEHVLKQIRQDFPHMRNLYIRSDNAGCYSGAAVICGRRQVCTNLGFDLKRVDFNEPQRGKDQADRDIAVAKSCIRAFGDRGGNLTNAKTIKEALDSSFGSLSGSKTSVLIIDTEKSQLSNVKIKDITKYHSVAFSHDSARFWQYFDIGHGRQVKIPECKFVSVSTVVQPFSTGYKTKEEFAMNTSSPGVIFFCTDPACSAVFDCETDLMDHEQSNDHMYWDEASVSTKDRARQVFLEHLKGARLLDNYASKIAMDSVSNCEASDIHGSCKNCSVRSVFCESGYAIRKRKALVRLTQKHYIFFEKLFDDGERRGQKYTVEKAHEEMRRARTINSVKLFTPSEYLNKGQIRSLFGRISKKRQIRTKTNKSPERQSKEDDISTDDYHTGTFDESSSEATDDDQDHYFDLEQEQTMENLINEEVDHALEIFQEPEDAWDAEDISNE